MSRHFIRLIKSIRCLGLKNGVLAFYYYFYYRLFRDRKWTAKQLSIGKEYERVWLRPGVSDWIVMERVFLDREYDPISAAHDRAMNQLHEKIASDGKQALIIDCGANIGLSSVWLARRFPNSVVVAIEPEPENFRILELNATNHPNIIPLNAAVASSPSRVSLSNEGDTPWAWRTSEITTGGVQATTISIVVETYQNLVLMCVKMDIEGFEVNALREDTGWVDKLALLIFEMHDWMVPWSGSGHSFFSVLAKHKRDYLIQGENVFSYSHGLLGQSTHAVRVNPDQVLV